MINKEELYKLALSDVHKYNLLNEIFAIWDKRVDKEDYCIAVNGFISLDVLNQYVNKDKEIERLKNIINNLDNYLLDIGVPRDFLKELKEGKQIKEESKSEIITDPHGDTVFIDYE